MTCNLLELRLNNRVHGGINERECKIISLKLNPRTSEIEFKAISNDNEKTEYYDIRPITVTKERIIKLGFMPLSDNVLQCNQSTDWKVSKGENWETVYIINSDTKNRVDCKIEYIHQLQNLLLDLAGVEIN